MLTRLRQSDRPALCRCGRDMADQQVRRCQVAEWSSVSENVQDDRVDQDDGPCPGFTSALQAGLSQSGPSKNRVAALPGNESIRPGGDRGRLIRAGIDNDKRTTWIDLDRH